MSSLPEHILVVDDLPAHRRVVAFNLKQAGFRVTTAEDAAQALKLAQQEQFDLIITDYFMPHRTGADLVRELRQSSEYADVPMILLTARAPELDLSQLASSLSVLIVSKSCSIGRLMGMVGGCLSARRSPTTT